MVATDKANNVSPAKEFTFDVRHGSSVAVGPEPLIHDRTVQAERDRHVLARCERCLAGV